MATTLFVVCTLYSVKARYPMRMVEGGKAQPIETFIDAEPITEWKKCSVQSSQNFSSLFPFF